MLSSAENRPVVWPLVYGDQRNDKCTWLVHFISDSFDSEERGLESTGILMRLFEKEIQGKEMLEVPKICYLC